MKKMALICMTLVLISSLAFSGEIYDRLLKEDKEAHEGVKEITYGQFMELRSSGEEYVLLDVLGPATYREGHIPGAENFPVMEINKKSAAKRLDKDSNIVVYCGSFNCMASVKAAKELAKSGYRVLDYKGGLREWIDKGNNLETPQGQIGE
jgi:rhodanese-related sulfurtransferase